jgi:hypothetical protein
LLFFLAETILSGAAAGRAGASCSSGDQANEAFAIGFSECDDTDAM